MTALLDRDTKCDGIGAGNVVQFTDVAVYMQGGTRSFADIVHAIVSQWHDFTLGKEQRRLDVRKDHQRTCMEKLSNDCVHASGGSLNMFKNIIDTNL